MDHIANIIQRQVSNGRGMPDLFGECGTVPTTKAPPHIQNAALGFTEFWAAWPKSDRKVAKQRCLDRWASLGCVSEWQKIVAHVEYMKRTRDWQKDEGSFVPQPVTYIFQQRWSEWEWVQPRRTEPTALEKIKADDKLVKPMPADVRAKLAALRGPKP